MDQPTVPLRPSRRCALLLVGATIAFAGLAAGQTPPEPVRQEPKVDPDLPKAVEQLVRDLELPARCAAALAELVKIGDPAVPGLQKALAAEQKRGRVEVMLLIEQALLRIDTAAARANFKLPAGDITIVADYSENKVSFFDATGKEVRTFTDVYGVWDARLTPQGTLLLTEFSVSRVRELDAAGRTVWEFEDLKNPYRATRLQNGNVFIADTFNGRVIEVNRDKKVVWKYEGCRPFSASRLDNGNTLIGDPANARVFEINAKGEVVFELKGMDQVHDADRLPNGNTLITLRLAGQVVEVDRAGNLVWKLEGLNAPSDAQRLPSGNTLVAENGRVREFDPDGKEVASTKQVWPVSVKRY